jgi:hypothetical protein
MCEGYAAVSSASLFQSSSSMQVCRAPAPTLPLRLSPTPVGSRGQTRTLQRLHHPLPLPTSSLVFTAAPLALAAASLAASVRSRVSTSSRVGASAAAAMARAACAV